MKRFTFGLFLAFVGGCGGSGSGGGFGGGGGGPATVHDAAVQLATIICQAAYQCCDAASAMKLTKSTDMSNCITVGTASIEKETMNGQLAITAGTATFDAAAASCFLSAYRGLYGSCTAAFDVSPLYACPRGLVVGTKAAGSPCAGAYECSAGSYCGSNICKLYAKAGEDCATTNCGTGLLCSSGHCVALRWLEDGQACGAPDTKCKSDKCVSGTCARVTLMDSCK